MRIPETLIVIMVLFSSCSNTCSSSQTCIKGINEDFIKIVQIIHDDDFFYTKDGDVKYSFRTAVLRQDKFEKEFGDDFFQNRTLLLFLLEKHSIDLFYVRSYDEIWFRICKKKSLFYMQYGFVGYITNLDENNLKLSSYKPHEVKKIMENWYWAQIKFSIVN